MLSDTLRAAPVACAASSMPPLFIDSTAELTTSSEEA